MTADAIRLEFDEIELQAVPTAGATRLEFDAASPAERSNSRRDKLAASGGNESFEWIA